MIDELRKEGVVPTRCLGAFPGIPSSMRMKRGPVALLECIEEIPCDPCVAACPKDAISITDGIVGVPILDENKCTGCGLCIPACPGLAIFVVDMNMSGDHGFARIPYEYYPLPEKGEKVLALDRWGEVVGEAKIDQVLSRSMFDGTAIVSLEVDRNLIMDVRSFRREV